MIKEISYCLFWLAASIACGIGMYLFCDHLMNVYW